MKRILFSTLTLLSVVSLVAAAPSERPSADASRTKAAEAIVSKLSKNIYRTEEYQDTYTEEVPYEAEETYYVDIPYQDTEDYWENVPYQTWEQVCRDNVTYRQECHTERVCNVAKLDFVQGIQIAEGDQGGRPGFGGGMGGGRGEGPGRGGFPGGHPGGPPGGGMGGGGGMPDRGGGGPGPDRGGHGGGGGWPGHGGGGGGHPGGGGGWPGHGGGGGHPGGGGNPPPPPPPPTCRNEQRCQQVPVRNRECHQEQVTRYRQERRTRTVTRYRQEARTRTVTRYRTETRCCVTKTRSVFDHQIAANVTYAFPAEATLEGDEKESFRTSLDRDGSVSVKVLKSIYTYNPVVTDQGNGQVLVQMNLLPTYQPEQLGAASIGSQRVTVVGQRSRLTFTDLGAVNKTRSHYALQLIDPATNAVLIEEQRDNLNHSEKVIWDLNVPSVAGKNVIVKLNVSREGVVIAGPVAFESAAELTVKQEAKYDPSPYTKASQIHHYRIEGVNEKIIVTFRDDSKVIDEVSTEYRLGIFVQEGRSGRLLAEKTFKREQMKVEKNGDMRLSLASDFGIAVEELAKLKYKTVIALSGNVIRYGSRFKNGTATVAMKGKLTVPKK